MLSGVVTGRLPEPLTPFAPEHAAFLGWTRSTAPPSLVLTPKGRIVAELRMIRLGEGEAGTLQLEGPLAGLDGLRALFAQVLPPRFARAALPPEALHVMTILGLDAHDVVAKVLAGAHDNPLAAERWRAELEQLNPGDVLTRAQLSEDGSAKSVFHVIRTHDVAPLAFDLVAPEPELRRSIATLKVLGVPEAPLALWNALRIEHGRPEFGIEFDADVLPPEAGLERRMVDATKGCYTGQEVIVRIRDRGKVNRHLRGLEVQTLEGVEPGTLLFVDGRARPVGEIRSTAFALNPQGAARALALAYVRHEVPPRSSIHVGGPEGPLAEVFALTPEGWLRGDPSP